MGAWDDSDLVRCFFVAGSAFLLSASFREFVRSIYREEKWQRADGRVVDVQYHRRVGRQLSTYTPTVYFRTRDGTEHTFFGLGTNPIRYCVGHSVKVLYDPAKPERAMIEDWLNLWVHACVCLGAGIVFGVIAWIHWWASTP